MQFEPKLGRFFFIIFCVFAGIAAFIAYGARTNGPANIVQDKDGNHHYPFWNGPKEGMVDVSSSFYVNEKEEWIDPMHNHGGEHGAEGHGAEHKEGAHEDAHGEKGHEGHDADAHKEGAAGHGEGEHGAEDAHKEESHTAPSH